MRKQRAICAALLGVVGAAMVVALMLPGRSLHRACRRIPSN